MFYHGKKYFWDSVHHMINMEVALLWFAHYTKIALLEFQKTGIEVQWGVGNVDTRFLQERRMCEILNTIMFW